MENEKRSIKPYLPILLIAAVVLAVVLLVPQDSGNTLFWLQMLFHAVTGQLLASAACAFGEWLFGRFAAGGRVNQVWVWFFSWERRDGRFHFSLIRNFAGAGGCALSGMKIARGPMCLYWGGGILVCLLLGGGLTTAAFFIDVPFFRYWCFVAGVLSLFWGLRLCASKLGKSVWALLRRKPEAEQYLGILQWYQKVGQGARPRDLTPPAAEKGFENQCYSQYLAYLTALDRNEVEKAALCMDWLAQYEEKLPRALEIGVRYSFCFMACLRGDREAAARYYERIAGTLQKDEDLNGLRTRAYCAYFIKRDSREALALCERALSAAGDFPVKGFVEMEIGLVRALQKQAQAALKEEESAEPTQQEEGSAHG